MTGERPDGRADAGTDALRRFSEIAAGLPRPKFDRVAVRDLRVFHSIPHRDPASYGGGFLPAGLTGVPVVVDEDVEVGAIELRLGDTVYKRVLLPELRA